jgi:hypothetical protein
MAEARRQARTRNQGAHWQSRERSASWRIEGRTRTANVDIDFTATDRKTKVLVELDKVSLSWAIDAV